MSVNKIVFLSTVYIEAEARRLREKAVASAIEPRAASGA